MMKHIMTFDIEAWYHGNFRNYDYRQYLGKVDDLVIPQTMKILDLLDETQSGATFFILGEVAESHPELVKEIHSRGHEIASHFMHHDLVYDMSAEQFRTELRQGIDILQQLVGEKVQGFRAPSWSVSMNRTPWFWEILAEEGISYSSSRFPLKTYLYGDSESPMCIHKIETEAGVIWEFPPACMRFAKFRIPFGGGFYFRFLPLSLIKHGLKWFKKKSEPAVLYLHPKETDSSVPLLKLCRIDAFVNEYGIARCYKKLSRLLFILETISFKEYLGKEDSTSNGNSR